MKKQLKILLALREDNEGQISKTEQALSPEEILLKMELSPKKKNKSLISSLKLM